MRASSAQADATAPLRASARTACRSVGQGAKPRAAAATATPVVATSSPSASSDAAVPLPATGCTAQPHGPDHSTTRRPVAPLLATNTSAGAERHRGGQGEGDGARPARRALHAGGARDPEQAQQREARRQPGGGRRIDAAPVPARARRA